MAGTPWNKDHRKNFWLDVVISDGCWTRGRPTANGYSHRFYHPHTRKRVQPHRYAYEDFYGVTLPDSVVVHHDCENPSCVRPSHLIPVTQKNHPGTTGYVNRQKTHCPQGHPYDETNTYTDKNGKRSCRTCLSIRDKARKAARHDRP